MESKREIPIIHTEIKEKKNFSMEENFVDSAKKALGGKLSDINIREGSDGLKLFNTSPMLIYEGYKPEQEYLKGLICQVTLEKGIKIVTCCFHKFYNLGEKPEIDKDFYSLIQQPDVAIIFPEKIDGTNIRLYVNPDTKEVKAATRGMIDGGKDPDEEGFEGASTIHFGQESLKIAQEQFPKILDKDLLEKYSPIFELIHPQNRIVTDYGDRMDLILLSVFDKQNGCRELTRKELTEFAQKYELNLVSVYQVRNSNWDETIKELEEQWRGTDKEGTVVTIEQNGEIVFRIKVKSKEYLELMRAIKFCTLNNTVGLVEKWKIESWENLKIKIHESYPDLPEEVMMGYEDYYNTIEKYEEEIKNQVDKIISNYMEFAIQNNTANVSQKDFALVIQERQDKSFFFLLRKFGSDKLDDARLKIIEKLKKQRPIKDF